MNAAEALERDSERLGLALKCVDAVLESRPEDPAHRQLRFTRSRLNKTARDFRRRHRRMLEANNQVEETQHA